MARQSLTRGLDAIIEFSGVGISLPKRRRRKGVGKRQRLRRLAGDSRREEVWVLRSASFSILPGESVAVLGGGLPARQALLRLAAGTLMPDEGHVRRSDTVIPMVELARALDRTFTIRQNIYLLGGLLGMTPDQIGPQVASIAEQAGVDSMMDRYLGAAPAVQRQRMAWTIAMATNARAFAVDRALVVGEREFKEQCWVQLNELKQRGTTFLVATDAPRPLREFCDRALVIIDGSIQAAGSVDEGIELLREARAQGKIDEPPLG